MTVKFLTLFVIMALTLMIISIAGSMNAYAGDSEQLPSQREFKSSDIAVQVSLSKAPALSQTAELKCTAFSQRGVPDAVIQIHLPEILALQEGNLSWQGNIKAYHTIEFKAIVKATKTGFCSIEPSVKRQGEYYLPYFRVRTISVFLTVADETSKTDIGEPMTSMVQHDKIMGEAYDNDSSTITLTPEQSAEADRLVEQYKKKFATDPNRIRFRSRYIITVSAGMIDADILENGKTAGNDYYLIQFYTDQADLDKETRDTINQIGCILYPGTENAFFAKILPEGLDTVISLVNNGKVRYLGRIPTEAKYYPELLAKAQKNPNNPIDVAIQLFDDASDSDLDTLNQLMRIDWHWTDSIAGEAPGGNIKDIISLNFVRWVEEDLPMGLCNNGGTPDTATSLDVRDYLVVLNTETAENKNSVLAVNGVQYIQDAIYTGFDSEKYPAIAISANEQAVEQIKNYDFVIAVSPLASISTEPAAQPDNETAQTMGTKQIFLVSILGVSIISLAMIIYLLIRRRRHA